MSSELTERLVAEVESLRRQVEILQAQETPAVALSEDNVSDPPTDAELDTAFGTPAANGEGFIGIVDDNNAANDVWFCVSMGGAWWYEELTKAV